MELLNLACDRVDHGSRICLLDEALDLLVVAVWVVIPSRRQRIRQPDDDCSVSLSSHTDNRRYTSWLSCDGDSLCVDEKASADSGRTPSSPIGPSPHVCLLYALNQSESHYFTTDARHHTTRTFLPDPHRFRPDHRPLATRQSPRHAGYQLQPDCLEDVHTTYISAPSYGLTANIHRTETGSAGITLDLRIGRELERTNSGRLLRRGGTVHAHRVVPGSGSGKLSRPDRWA
jgi:hypothetical protein